MRKLALAAEILATYLHVRMTLRRSNLPDALKRLRGARRRRTDAYAVPTGRRLGRAVARALGPLPADTRCLMQSLVLTRLLARRGIDTRLVIAVRPGEGFAAHAWVEHDDVALLPTGAPAFEELVTL